MARSGRPASESYQSFGCSVGQALSSTGKAGGLEDEDDRAPIFSLSKSSVDVVVQAGSPHKRDPAWTRLSLKRSSSTDTHSDQNRGTLQQLRHNKWRHNSHQFSPTTQNEDLMSPPPPLSERWISNTHRWSGCSSSSTLSRSSTPDTVVWTEGSPLPCSLNQDAPGSVTPDSPMSKLASPPLTPSPLVSPFHTPTLQPKGLLTSSSSSPLALSAHQLPESSPHPWSAGARRQGSSEKLLFQFPSPVPSHFSLADSQGRSDPGCLVNDAVRELPSPGDARGPDGEGATTSLRAICDATLNSSAEKRELKSSSSSNRGRNCLMDRGRRSPLVSSLSDSQLGNCCTCNLSPRGRALKTPKSFREEGTMTSRLETVEAAVQTASPLGSCCDLQRDVSASNTGLHSLLGSPPGSRLNLKSPTGSHSNLVSASSSMFPVSSGGEEEEKKKGDPEWDAASGSPHCSERRKSCLKLQPEEREDRSRRGSMKQVLWDEEGLTWGVHGASLSPEELSAAIQKHLELEGGPKPPRPSSKKKKAPMPPLASSAATAADPEPATSVKLVVEGESEAATDKGGEEARQEPEEASRRRSRTEKENATSTEEEVRPQEEAGSRAKSPSHGSKNSTKKTKTRSLMRAGWCGGSRTTDDSN